MWLVYRWSTQAIRLYLLTIVAVLVVCYIRIAAPPKYPQASWRKEIIQPQNATTATVAFHDEYHDPDATGPLVTYGSNRTIPEFVGIPGRGAKILLLAYAR